ncbi:MAG: hypothetical protein HY791_11415 [Deltaproteobacteria bacterium]|nr:hypothetical protein [Deltaproteobacteria bacterium]
MITVDIMTRPMSAANELVRKLGPHVHRVYVEAFGEPAPFRSRFTSYLQRLGTTLGPRRPRESEIFGSYAAVDARLTRPFGHRGFDQVAPELRANPPDLLVLLGSSLVPESIIRSPRLGCLNVHLGLAPRYRGLFTTEWAILFGELEGIGVTIHEVTPAVDAGRVVARGWPKLEARDDARSIDLRLLALGTDLIREVVAGLEAGQRLAPESQSSKGRLFLRREFLPAHAKLVEERVRAGMISSFSPRSRKRVEGPFWRT